MRQQDVSRRGSLLWAALLVSAVWLSTATPTEAAAPTIISDPSQNPPDSASAPAIFFFNHPQGMDRAAIDVTWQGTGLDPARISYEWQPPVIPGFPAFPAFSLECTYPGGWPAGVKVTWTLNRGNSGVMKSVNGEVLAETSGTFTTPGTPGGGGQVTITPSATQVAVGQKLTFQFSAAMDTSVSPDSIFGISDGDWQAAWESGTVLACTLTGGVSAGASISAEYTLSGLRTAAGTEVADFSGNVTLRGAGGGSVPAVTPPSGLINGKAVFVFNMPMDPAGLDVKWAGNGVDPSKITSSWLVLNIPGVVIPVSTFESSYEGGWPSTTQVMWTLNQGNSGVIKSADGVALPEVSGSFITPINPGGGPGPGECDPSAEDDAGGAALSLSKEINFLQTSAADPVFDTEEKATVNASVFTSASNSPPAVVQSATLNKPAGGSVPLVKLEFPDFEIPDVDVPGVVIPDIPDSFFLSVTPPPDITPPSFNSVEELNAAYPNGNYSLTVTLSGGGTRTVVLPMTPTGEPPVPKITNYEALQGFDATKDVVVQWNPFTGAGANDLIQLHLVEKGGPSYYFAPNKCANIELLVTDTSHTIPAGKLRAGASYELRLSFGKVIHVRQPDDQTGSANSHIPGYAEFTMFSKTTRTAAGAPQAAADLRFSRVFAEKVGGSPLLSMEVSGSLPAGAVAQVESSTDLKTWTRTGIVISQAALQANGGVLVVQDPTGLTGGSAPHKFYRIILL